MGEEMTDDEVGDLLPEELRDAWEDIRIVRRPDITRIRQAFELLAAAVEERRKTQGKLQKAELGLRFYRKFTDGGDMATEILAELEGGDEADTDARGE